MESIEASFIYQFCPPFTPLFLYAVCCLFKCKPRSNHTFNRSQHTRKEVVKAKEYSHNKRFLFWKKIGNAEIMLLALVNIMYHAFLDEHSKGTLMEEGVPCWVKMAVLDPVWKHFPYLLLSTTTCEVGSGIYFFSRSCIYCHSSLPIVGSQGHWGWP